MEFEVKTIGPVEATGVVEASGPVEASGTAEVPRRCDWSGGRQILARPSRDADHGRRVRGEARAAGHPPREGRGAGAGPDEPGGTVRDAVVEVEAAARQPPVSPQEFTGLALEDLLFPE